MSPTRANHNIDSLESKVESMGRELHRLADTERLIEKIKTDIRGPGYTTPAEFFLVRELVEAITAAASGLAHMENTLLESSGLIVDQG
ncbi:hypothetical protein ERC79_14060 [Rhodococcus sp. ABRD24]|uniref:hypothetical protein n=1 Tax=Rhodococcus sp. ABRD24 TaxID=2507582 RepID=UPI00103E72FC|nr:hypothetical protein [Rhodococcus sp. ABRD24]QBJ96950.1 hypothetical protein ERC79_14060 [Rhodococcus sp. ABRD24]